MESYYKSYRNYLCQKFCLCSLHVAILLLAIGLISQNIHAGDIDPTHYATGVRELTPEQVKDINENWPRVLSVKLNKYGAARIQEHLKKTNQPMMAFAIADSIENEFITNKNSNKFSALSGRETIGVLPPHVDNSQLPSFPPIGDQKQEGSCVGFGTTYYSATHEYGLINGVNNKTSSAGIRSPKWTYNMINRGQDNGSSATDAYDLLSKNGAPANNDFPYDGTNYTAWDLNPQDWISAMSYRMGAPQFLFVQGPQDIDTIKQILNNGHVLTFITYAYSWVITSVKADPSTTNNPYAGQYAISWLNGKSGGHLPTIVGYDDNVWIDMNGNGVVDPGEKGAFLVANSWGTGWGNSGFIWISYDAFFASSTVTNGPSTNRVPASEVLFVTAAKSAAYRPQLVAKFALTQSLRNQISMKAGVSDINTTAPITQFVSAALSQDGGLLAFDGGQPRNLTQTFALDLTDLLPSATQSSTQRYYLITSDAAVNNPTTLNSYSLVDLVNNREVSSTATPLNCDNSTIQPYIDYNFTNNPDPTPPTVAITSPSDQAAVSGTINVTANASDNVGVTRVDFYVDSTLQLSDTSAPYLLVLDTTTLSDGQHTLTAIAYDGAGNQAQSVVTITVKNAASSIYINAGGDSAKDICNSVVWSADNYFTGGAKYVNASLPTFLGIYRSERRGNFSYKIPVNNGGKIVVLKFAEIVFQSTGKRIFNVNINGQRVISNLDIFALAGYGNPLERRFKINVTNGIVQIDFISVTDNAKVNGIAILPQ